jgi:hypothetical protein
VGDPRDGSAEPVTVPKKDIDLYASLIERRAALTAELDPGQLDRGIDDRVRRISEALLSGAEPPTFPSRPQTQLLLDGVNRALSVLVEDIGERVAKENGHTFDELNVRLDDFPETVGVLATHVESACELADREDDETTRRRALKDRYDVAFEEYNRLSFEGEREGLESAVASERAKAKMADPDGLWCIEGQPGHPSMVGRSIGTAQIERGELVAD